MAYLPSYRDTASDNTFAAVTAREAYGFRDVYVCDATAAAERNMGLSIPNSAMLGALAKTGLVSIEATEKAIADSFGKVGEMNVNAARDAYEHTEKA